MTQRRAPARLPTRHAGVRAPLDIDGKPVHGVERLADGFIDGRMRVDGVHHGLHGGLGLHRQHAFGDQLIRLRADDVHAQDLAILLIGDDLDEAVVLAQDRGLAVGQERKLPDLDLVSLGSRLRFGETDAADAGFGVGRAGDAIPVDRRRRLTGNVRDGHHALGGSDVRQLRRPGDDIADGVHAGLAGALHLVHFDEAAVQLDAGSFEADVLGIGLAPDGDEKRFGFDRFALAVIQRGVEADARIGSLDAGDIHSRAGLDANSGLLEVAQEFFRDFLIFHWNDARQHLKHRYFAAEAVEAGGEFDAYRTRAEYRQRLGYVRQIQNLDVSENALGIRLKPREHARLRAGGEHNGTRFEDLRGSVAGDLDATLAGEAAVALDPIDLVLLHQELDALGVLGNDLILAVEDQGEIEAGIVAMQAIGLRMLEALPDIGGVEEGLGGNAADQQAGSTQPGVFFDNCGFQAVLSRADSRRISTGAAPDDDYVVGHEVILFQCSFSGSKPRDS